MVVDTKAGWCSMCRRGNHDLCVKDRHHGKCECDGGVKRGHLPPDPVVARPAPPAPATNGLTVIPAAEFDRARKDNGAAAAPKHVLAWEDPPPKRSALAPISFEAEAELRANPERWAKVRQYKAHSGAAAAAKAIRDGKHGLKPTDWEVRAAGAVLYVRFVGRGGA